MTLYQTLLILSLGYIVISFVCTVIIVFIAIRKSRANFEHTWKGEHK